MQERTKSRRTGIFTAFGASVMLAVTLPVQALSAQEGLDTIVLKDGTTEVGSVLEETHVGLTLKPEKGAKKTLPWDTVQAVEYAEAPAELGNGMTSLNLSQYEDAIGRFALVLESDEKPRPMIQQQALFYSAYAQQRAGFSDDAIAGYKVVLTDFPEGRFLRAASDNLIALYSRQGDFAAAQTALDGIAAGAAEVPGFAADLAILRGRLLLAQEKVVDARAQFEEAEKVVDAPESVRQEARVCRAGALLAEGKRAEAEAIFVELKNGSASPRVHSAAWNGLGQIFTEDGKTKRDAERLLEGLYSYLRPVVQYKPLPGESTEEYERALAGAHQCFKHISELEQNNERKKLYAQRSREKLEQLQREFPNSAYLQSN